MLAWFCSDARGRVAAANRADYMRGMSETQTGAPLLPILIYPDSVLRKQARPVTPADADEVRALVPSMFATMYKAPGIGLAANQIGSLLRVIVVDVAPKDEPAPIALINPEIIAKSDETGHPGGRLPVNSRPIRRGHPPGPGEGALPGPGGHEEGDRGRRAVCGLPAA